jgi:DNA recombination protein RmuC
MNSLLLIVSLLALAGFAFLFYKQIGGGANKNEEKMSDLTKQVQDLLKISLAQQNESMKQQQEMRRQMDERLKEMSTSLERQHKTVGERLDNAARAVSDVKKGLGELSGATKQMIDVGKDISSLQEILRAPKLRGNLGELFLENLLGQILPGQELYELQYAFKGGEKVDAVIRLIDNMLVCVDSKFPLENFQKMIDAQTEKDEKREFQCRKAFFSDVKKHVDAIASKYILPDEGTLNFALMYIPAENVYYETITKDLADEGNISQYALSKRVIPVSPNTFYLYLQTLLIGFKGMQVQKNAQHILDRLSRLKGDFGKFAESYELVGTHLQHAQASFDKSEKKLEQFGGRLEMVESSGENVKMLN